MKHPKHPRALFPLLLLVLSLFQSASLQANDKDTTQNDSDSLTAMINKMIEFTDSVNKALKWEHGNITISNGAVNLNVPQGYRYLNAAQSRDVLEKLWGNMEDNSVLGMIFPENKGPLDDSSYAYVITFNDMGFVKDDDADKINYDDLMKEMKENMVKENEERKKLGMEAFNLIGWAQPPFYDKTNKVLHWAKEFHVDGAEANTLNYDIRILGRKGVLSMNAISTMDQLPMIKGNVDKILKMAEFTDGNKYSDFNPDVDEVAAWTIGGLVAGKVLAKVGLWAVVGKFLKFIIIGVVAAGGAIWKWMKGRKDEQQA